VVEADNNATMIHYISNTQMVGACDMVLVNVDCDYSGYWCDVTRTWPGSGQFSDTQRVLYELRANGADGH
jgi:Xaa-Pro aminopeptidase